MIELERTFLARRLPEIRAEGMEVLDHYIPQSEKHPCLRLRKNGDKFFLTKKKPLSGADASEQSEETIILSGEEHSALSNPDSTILELVV